MEPQGAREFSVYLHDPWTEAVMRVVFMDASPHGLGFLPREDRRKKFHDAGVSTHCYQRLEVIIDPGAQPQPRRLDLHHICIIIDSRKHDPTISGRLPAQRIGAAEESEDLLNCS